jgi:mannose-1-phosphate guanylyltransferase
MSSPYLEEAFHPFIEARRGEPAITWVTETEPLGTGGAIVNTLEAVGDEPFFALNGDICTDLDLSAMRAFHKEQQASVTIALHHVEDARAFGLVITDPERRVLEFREKPEDPIPGDVNAGTYLLNPAVLRPWTADHEISIEREIFPAVIDSGARVAGYLAPAYWMDLGTPEKYLQAHFDLLEGLVRGVTYEAPWIAPTADVEPGATVGVRSAVGAEARIARGATIEDSVVHPGASVAPGGLVRRSIVGPGARVSADASVTDCVLGAGSLVPEGVRISGVKVPTDGEAVPS